MHVNNQQQVGSFPRHLCVVSSVVASNSFVGAEGDKVHAMAEKTKRHDKGGKCPRQWVPTQGLDFCLVEFKPTDGKKSHKSLDMDVVPKIWIINGKNPKVCWPANPRLSRKQLDHMVRTQVIPDSNWPQLDVRILYPATTYDEALQKMETAAVTSDLGGNTSTKSKIVQSSEHDDADADSSSDEIIQKPIKKKAKAAKSGKLSTHKSAKLVEKSVELSSDEVFSDGDADQAVEDLLTSSYSFNSNGSKPQNSADFSPVHPLQSGRINLSSGSKRKNSPVRLHMTEGTNKRLSIDTSLDVWGSGSSKTSRSANASLLQTTNDFSHLKSPVSTVSRNLFKDSPSEQYITKAEFAVFERKIFTKLNEVMQSISGLKESSVHQMYKCPSLGDDLVLPVNSVADLQKLNEKLDNRGVRCELANHLKDLGGEKLSDFLQRALPRIVTDDLCHYTNWTGSAVPEGARNISDGSLLPPGNKAEFRKFTNVVMLFIESAKLVAKIKHSTTESDVQKYIKSWLLHFKERIKPRSHKGRGPRTTPKKTPQKSPKKTPQKSPKKTS